MGPYQKEMLKSALQSFGKCDVIVQGESMKPFIRSGDTVSLSPIADVPQLGEVIAFFNDDQLLVHRIIWRKHLVPGFWYFWVWGDSSPGMPGRVSLRECIGKVVRISRNNQRHNLWIYFPFRILALLAGIFLHTLHLLKK
jgi:signal peptidase I